MELNLRPHSINCYALSKLQYRFNVIDPRVSDTKYFLSQSKNFIQGGFFDCSALKMTKCQPLKEISELFLPKND